MTGRERRKIKNEHGAVQIVEASFVFPVMFIILFFLIYMGNAFYTKAQIDAVVTQHAILGANYCADPILETIVNEGGIPSIDDLDVEPYRYIFGGMDDVEKEIAGKVESAIEGNTVSFFKNMKPNIQTPRNKIAKFNNYVIYSTFAVEVMYEIEFPIRFLGRKTPTILTLTSRAEAPVSDTCEFIRNTDMVLDLFGETKIGQTISDVFGKINDFISSFASK